MKKLFYKAGLLILATLLSFSISLSAQSGAIFYQDCNYLGYAVTLPVGNYTTSDLISKGIKDNDISSIKASGLNITVYKDNNYGGANLIVTNDLSCLNTNGWNDQISSIKITSGNGDTGNDCTGVQTWNQQTVYPNAGTKVVLNNKLYKNNWYTQNQNPEQNSGLYQTWTLLGTCGTSVTRVTGVTLQLSTATILISGTVQLNQTVIPSNATNKTVTWSSSNSNIAKVSTTGLVSGISIGQATITVTTVDNTKKATCLVTVANGTVHVESITVNPSNISMLTSAFTQLTATVLPTNATNKTVNWSSSNTAVATVNSSGLVNSLTVAGSTIITATTVDGLKSSTSTISVTLSQDDYNQGIATHFLELGKPYGGCGVPQDILETQNFVALNVWNTPGTYQMYTRPIPNSDFSIMGEFKNGYNCGRWIQVTMGADCDGINDGHQNQDFCRGGAGWYNDKYSNATLYMIVADACGDNNAWCRDSRYHLDLATNSLNKFELAGTPVNDMLPLNWNNRQIKWKYIQAPNYSGDIKIYFMKDAQFYWPAILINHLPNGIHGVEQKVGNQWIKATRNSDMGQSFILPNSTNPFIIRVIDADDKLLFNGREYSFTTPTECGGACTKSATIAAYVTNGQKSSRSEISNDVPQAKTHIDLTGNSAILVWESAFDGNIEIKVFNTLGQLVKQSTTYTSGSKGSEELGVFKSGIYLVKII